MGFFSWKASDTGRSISNSSSVRGALPVYLLTPKNEKIFEDNYDGYGRFGGHDVFYLLAHWNWPDECTGDLDHDRCLAIDKAYRNEEEVKYPIKLVEDGTLDYDEVEASEDCPEQGYFYDDEFEDEWEDY